MKKIFCLLIFTLLFSFSAYSQDATKGDGKPKQEFTKYIVKPKFPVNVAFSFKKSTTTKVTQFLSDSTSRSFRRTLDVFFTYYSPEKPQNGITELRVSVDSLVWKYVSGGDSVYYDTQNDDMVPPFKYIDYEASSVVLGKTFSFYYSPYWDFGKIQSNKLTESRNLVNDPTNGILDSIRNYVWNYRMSDNYLADLTDILKDLIPTTPIDSSMIRKFPFKIESEEIAFSDTAATVQLVKSNSQVHILRAKMNNLSSDKNFVRIFGFGVMTKLLNSNGKGTYELEISPQGRIDGAKGKFNYELLFQDRNETIKEIIEEEITYQLLKNYKV
jgi:hypothetical protein